MKKFLVLFLILVCLAPTAFAKKKAKLIIPEGSGYVGSLPNLEERFQKSQEKEAEPLFDSQSGFSNNDKIKNIPRDNPAFVNIILKKDKTSQYVNDMNELIPLLEKIQTAIENGENVQKFNASTYYLNKNVEYLRNKYQNKAEESYISFKKLADLNMQAQSISLLRSEREIYSPYLAYSDKGYVLNPNNIDTQLSYLLKNIQETLIVLKEVR